ncbi:uncharacterized protein [Watersipora subatra]|uniref:uncharacterized protein n=1 Tax=Watersipora subatra TaxID=2589382 RepID=UPI00355AE322
MVIYEHLRSSDDDHVYAQLQPKHIKELFFNIKSTIGCSFSAEINTFATGEENWSLKELAYKERIKELVQIVSDLQQQNLSRPEIKGNGKTPSYSAQYADYAEIQESTQTPSCSGHEREVSTNVNETTQDLFKFPWYVGLCKTDEAIQMLHMYGSSHGLFLVRELRRMPGARAIVVNVQGKYHDILIRKANKAYSIDHGKTKFSSIPGLVRYYQSHSLQEAYPYLTTRLRIPYHHPTQITHL